ncbi:MAG: S26 family signal peptidase [Candidatus Methanoplasma sp.]|jgi:signal peptidase|nr:S26 family signal peptidase [Candidatus Methanoplasma sp.]
MDAYRKMGVAAALMAVLAVAGAFAAVVYESGADHPLSTVRSYSMQHGKESQLGVIDVGDLIVVKAPDRKGVVTYVEGLVSGYRSMGSYGDVILFDSSGTNIIHRAILYLEYNGDGTWSAPALRDYPESKWFCGSGAPWDALKGTLVLKDMRYTGELAVEINLDDLAAKYPHSGYLTMGDYNTALDQRANVSDGLVKAEDIKGVAWMEIPWAGSIKLLMSGNNTMLNGYAPNSIPCLAASIAAILLLALGFNVAFDHFAVRRRRDALERDR